jgi:plastocyanin
VNKGEEDLMRGRVKALGVLLMAVVLVTAACGGDGGTADGATADGGTADGATADGGTADGATPDGGTACEPSGPIIEVSAEGVSFDQSCLAAPAGQPFTIGFTNNDGGIPHNVAIYTDESAAESVFVGEIFQGVDTMSYEVPALEPGTFFFRCDVHPGQMTGTFVVK